MDIIEVTERTGPCLQADERYVVWHGGRPEGPATRDQALQEAIGEFNLKRMAINNEAQKDDRNEETIKRLNEEFRAVYQRIMENEHMRPVQRGQERLRRPVQRITGIIGLCADGEDPNTAGLRSRLLPAAIAPLRRLPHERKERKKARAGETPPFGHGR